MKAWKDRKIKIRIPMPKCGGPMKSKKDYNRQKEKRNAKLEQCNY